MIASDKTIKQLVSDYQMIEPFIPESIKVIDGIGKVPSFGLSCAGYDVRLERNFKLFCRPHMGKVIDILDFKEDDFCESFTADSIIIPPGGLLLGNTVEYFKMPTNVLGTCVGKAQSLDSLVKIPGGWKRMGDVKVGDELVAPDGGGTWVDSVHPQGQQQLYNITFNDGRVVEACGKHLWEVLIPTATDASRRKRVINTNEIARTLKETKVRLYVPLITPPKDADVTLPLDPWFLGAWLGDGTFSNNGVSFSTTHQFILNKLKTTSPEGVTIRDGKNGSSRSIDGINAFRSILRDLELDGCLSNGKFIPKRYLEASASQRLSLLQGLMDTDGTAGKLLPRAKTGSSSYSTVSEQLALDVQYLVRSLGGMARITSRYTNYTLPSGEVKQGQLCYKVAIRVRTPEMLFTLPVKLDRVKNTQYTSKLNLGIVSVEPSRVAPAQCITVTHKDHLYITDDFTVTHNSTWARLGASVLVTPLEPGWEGQLVVEINNGTNHPLKIYAGVGIAQIQFALLDQEPDVPYNSRMGKYQGQRGVQRSIL